MKQIVITLDLAEIRELEKQGDKDAVAKVLVNHPIKNSKFISCPY